MSATKPVRAAPYGVVTANNTFATTTYWSPGVYPSPMLHSYDYYLSEPITQVKGKTILFQADFTIHDFSNANEFYCGVRGRGRRMRQAPGRDSSRGGLETLQYVIQ